MGERLIYYRRGRACASLVHWACVRLGHAIGPQTIRNWKTVVVRPLLKKLSLELINSNFRPVSNLSFLSKVIESCMLLQLNQHSKKYGLQPDYQSAYREHHSCETAILQLSNDILWSMERQSITSLVAIDLSAAFDTVDHEILLDILKHKFGIEGKALQWFNNYLRPRSFKVITDGTYSQEQDLEVSVPQGSCAGANIFNLYCAPLEEVIHPGLKISGFADDHSIRDSFKANDRMAELQTINNLQQCMLNIKHWMDRARLKMNPSKTEFIYFGFNRQLEKCSEKEISVAGDLIIRSDVIRYLGVWMDSSLNFKTHTTKKCQSAMINFLKIRKIRHLLNTDTTASLCLSLCISHLDYCNAVLYNIPKVTLSKLQRIQNMCAHLVLRKSKMDSISECLKQLHWLPIRQRVHFKILVLTYKCLHGQGPAYLIDLLQPQTPIRSGLWSSSSQDSYLHLSVPRTKCKTFADRSFSVGAPTLWNSLPRHIKEATLVLTFKNMVKTHLFKKAFPD